ncbi:hypothetical protein C5167_027910 [Papaver somniferum]|nr:hypothetical protein C5167_027910 [Papaver somniferum]
MPIIPLTSNNKENCELVRISDGVVFSSKYILIILGFYESGVARNRALDPAVLSRLKQFSAMTGVGTISMLIKQGDDIKCVISTKFHLVHINMY